MSDLREISPNLDAAFQKASDYHGIPTEEGRHIARTAMMLDEIDSIENGEMCFVAPDKIQDYFAAIGEGQKDGENRRNPHYKSKYYDFGKNPIPQNKGIITEIPKKEICISTRSFLFMQEVPENKLPAFMQHSCRRDNNS
ncbi:MAG: hypothetical protein LBU68_00585 [Rickettsiales bacterium]|jgi:hypothetical protein|nr:hypothetical protein [Rickettsiales bacterium]